MAEIVVSAFFSLFFDKLASEALNKIARAMGIEFELKKLKTSLIQIKYLLNDASQKELTDEAVKEWVNGLQHLAYDIDDLLDDLATEAMGHELAEEAGATSSKVRKLIPTCFTKFSLSSKIHGKLDDITIKLQELFEEKNNLGLSVITSERPKVIRYEASLVDTSCIIGREGDKKVFLEKLLVGKDESCKQNFSIVPIVGMGGVGKTTVARLLYDEKEVKDRFELRAWVCVSDEFSVSNISKVIYQSVTGENKEFADLNLLQEALKEKIKNKLFLLVLDDVWSESYDDWDKLVGPFIVAAPGSKIIMTTRKEQLLRKLGYAHVDPLKSLPHDDALCLFSQHALGVDNFDSHPTLRPHGEGFVRKCDGLPLALRALGRLLRTKIDEEEWKELLDSEIWRLGSRDEIVPALRLSYHDLSASLKLLFAYCSLFPKDYVFEKEELILLWMAEGFLHQLNTKKSMERLGVEYFEELFSRSFFQHAPNDKSLFVMHDLMNDLATAVAGDFFLRSDIETEKEFGKEVVEKYRHMSLVCEKYMAYQRFKPFTGANNLRTFLALSSEGSKTWQTFCSSNKVLVDLLQELPLLRVLCLSQLTLREVPESIGSLKHLRYLNLSRTRITHLTDNVCNLYNLQTLIVSGCSILKKLPQSFSKLKNLRHFDMRDTPYLKKMPLGILELKNLQTLHGIVIEGDNGCSITELKYVKDLQGKISISGLDKVQSRMHAEEANLSQKRLSGLELKWSDVFDSSRNEALEKEVLNVLKPRSDNLKHLKIVSYGGIEFPNWIGDPSFFRLAELSIHGCKRCTSLPILGQLPSLKKLFIEGMDEVEFVGPEFLGTGLAFPSLETLSFRDMKWWEVWSSNRGVVDTAFPCLQELHIERCPNLLEVSLEELPSLDLLEINGCCYDVLSSLVRVASSVTVLDITDIFGADQLFGGVIEYLGEVEVVSIKSCDEISYLWESSEAEASNFLLNLRELEVSRCSSLVSLGEEEEDSCGRNLTSLTSLELYYCNSLAHCSCPNSLETLRITGCDSLTSVSFPTGGWQQLKSLTIAGCEKLLGTELGGGEEKGNLRSVSELSCFIHLFRLEISDSPNMESFPDHELPNLTMLTEVKIVNCQSTDASFPRGCWPPKLCSLSIGGLKKSISKWGPQNFPTSLAKLVLIGRRSEDVRNFSQLSHLFPSTLTSLEISGFQNLDSASMGLQHLTALQYLCIKNCPKIIYLPETLLPSLLSLRIRECPNLTERSNKGGSYWPLISHIPYTYIR